MLRRSALALIAILTGLAPAYAGAQASLELLGRYLISDQSDDFGGLSGLEMSADGTQAFILSDRGLLFDVALTRDGSGIISSADVTGQIRLRKHQGKGRPDSEGLVIATDGTIHVSAEGPSRVITYQDEPVSFPIHMPPIPFPETSDSNQGLEALAMAPNGDFYTIPEAPETS